MSTLNRVRRLLRLSRQANEHEAAAARGAAVRLAMAHGFISSEPEIDTIDPDVYDDPSGDEPLPNLTDVARVSVDDWGRAIAWRTALAHGVCKTYGIGHVVRKSARRTHSHGPIRGGLDFFGQPDDIRDAQIMYAAIVGAIEREATIAVREYSASRSPWDDSAKSWGNGWRNGCARTISDALESKAEEREEAEARARAARTKAIGGGAGTTALAVYDKRLARLDALARLDSEAQALLDAWEQAQGFSEVRYSSGSSADGYAAGQRAGKRMDTSGPRAIRK